MKVATRLRAATLAGAVCLALAGQAAAADFNVPTIGPGPYAGYDSGNISVGAGLFEDIFHFDVVGSNNVFIRASAFNAFAPSFLINGFSMALFRDTGGGVEVAVPGGSAGPGESLALVNLPLGPIAGSFHYHLKVSGVGAGTLLPTQAGAYKVTIDATPAPVPEASTWLMMAAGLPLLGLIARRRARDKA